MWYIPLRLALITIGVALVIGVPWALFKEHIPPMGGSDYDEE